MIDVPPEHLETIKRILAEHVPDCEVRAFGSRVTWTAKDYSDLDLAVVCREELSADKLRLIREAFELSELPFRVDVVDWHAISARFRRAIRRHCEPIHVHGEPDGSTRGPRGWIEATLGDVIELQRGYDLPKRHRTAGSVPVVSSSGVIDYHSEAKVKGPGVATGRYGTLGQVYFVRDDFWPLNTTLYVRDFKGNDPRFIGYFLTSLDYLAYSDKAAVPGINRNHLHQASVLFPADVEEQRAIAYVLGTLDDKIELNRRMSDTLKEIARALFKSWFVDFDPVRAKAEDADPGLPCSIADLFPDRLVDSELGEIPDGWNIQPLDEVAHFQNGLALQKYRPKDDEGRLPVVKIAQLRSGKADSDEWATADLKPECIIDDGDVVFSWSGSLLVRVWSGGRAALNQHLFKVTSEQYPRWFFLEALLSHLPEFRRIAAGKATTMGHIRRYHLTTALCVVPPASLLEATDALFSRFIDRAVRSDIDSRIVGELRDTLLPKLTSGDLRIPDTGTSIGKPE